MAFDNLFTLAATRGFYSCFTFKLQRAMRTPNSRTNLAVPLKRSEPEAQRWHSSAMGNNGHSDLH
jgi:hypothetical protein